MQKPLPDLDQLLLDKYSCYCLFSIDEEGNLLFSGNLKATDKALENFAFLYSQLEYGPTIIDSIKSMAKKMTKEELLLFADLMVSYKKNNLEKPVIQPIDNIQKSQ
jgi:hypothetical protein